MKLNFKAAATIKRDDEASSLDEKKHHILLVDDEAPNLQGLERQLKPYYKITALTSAKEALKLIDDGGPEFSTIVSDQIMPEMSGVEFLTELKKRQHSAPRIMLTGYAALDNVVSAINEAGIFRYMTKPVYHDQLTQVLREAVAHYEMTQENRNLIRLVKDLLEKKSEMGKHLGSDGKADSSWEEISQNYKPRRHEIVVLFADIRGFTQVTRKAEPEQVIRVLDKIFEPMHQIIYQSGGIVDKHLGDGLMAIFGLSGASAIHASVMATAAMAERTAKVLETIEPPFDQLKLSFGLSAGTVVLGMIGSANRGEFAVVGDAANLAARLQELSKLSLTSGVGREYLGEFNRVMAVCSENMLEIESKFSRVDLPSELRIRDFNDISTIGILSA